MADVEVAVVNGESHSEVVMTNGDHVEEITSDFKDVKIEVKSFSSVKTSHSVTTSSSVKTVESVTEDSADVVVNGDVKPDVVAVNGDEKKDAEKDAVEGEKEDKEEKADDDKVDETDKTEEVAEVVENGEVAKVEGETPDTPSKKKNGIKGIKIQTTPNSPVGKLLRFFACGSNNAEDAGDKPKTIEDKKSPAFITDPKAGEWEGNTKVKFGMDVVTKVDTEDNIPRHYAAQVAKNGLAEQFGLRNEDELLLMNLFNLAGRSHQDVLQILADEEAGRKTHLISRRVVSGGKKTDKKLYDYHQVTGFMQMLMVADETKPVNDEYQVNNLQKHVSREPGAEGLMLATENVQISSVSEDTQKHLCFRNNGLTIDTESAVNDEFTFEMLVRVSPTSPIKTRVFFRHKKDEGTDFMYMAEQETDVIMKDDAEEEDNKTVPEERSLVLQGVSNKSQTYALQTHALDGTYVTLDESTVKVKTLPEGTALSDATEVHFRLSLL